MLLKCPDWTVIFDGGVRLSELLVSKEHTGILDRKILHVIHVGV